MAAPVVSDLVHPTPEPTPSPLPLVTPPPPKPDEIGTRPTTETYLDELEAAVVAMADELTMPTVQKYCLTSREAWAMVWGKWPAGARPTDCPEHRELLERFEGLAARGAQYARSFLGDTPDQYRLLREYRHSYTARLRFARVLLDDGPKAIEQAIARHEAEQRAAKLVDIDEPLPAVRIG